MSVTIDSVLVQGKDLATADIDGGVVVLSVRAGAYFGFNGVASEIWQHYFQALPGRRNPVRAVTKSRRE